ncbi:protein Mpv17 [Patella vulgata]|uniref:protein Mpv17 n=1 Tax=Patella vulgata TaxID=6465 RepID=UPI00217F68A5|nr:protein Mpv17 [Patella vulgata]
MTTVWRWYLRSLQKYPTRTMATTTGTIMTSGDLLSQLVIEKKQYEPVRSLRYLGFGLIFLGPLMRGWYLLLERLYAGTRLASLKMVVTDQLSFAPLVCFSFVTGMGLLKGDSVADIKKTLNEIYFDILIANYQVWPAAQLINFYFVPLQHRVLVVNFVALGWNTYLAWKSEKSKSSS